MSIPVVMSASGAIPTAPLTLRDQLIELAIAANPGLTTNLPGTLIEDIASTDVGALTLIDQARVETINSVTPLGANLFLLNQLGQIYGVQQSQTEYVSVNIVFTGTPGYVIDAGVIVSDGTYQYVTQNATVIGYSTFSEQVYCVASVSGTWSVPANTVTNIVSSIPSGVIISVTNPAAGIPPQAAQTPEEYRSAVLDAGKIGASGMIQAIKTYVKNVPGVVQNLVSVTQNTPGGTAWKVIVKGGDPKEVAYAIWQSCGDPAVLSGASEGGVTASQTIFDIPDTYLITWVIPVEQSVEALVTWNTDITNVVSNSAIDALCSQTIADYINNLGPGQPINIYEIQYVFQESVQSILPTAFITNIEVQITIDNVIVPPSPGTGIVIGDAEGYYYSGVEDITTVRG